MDRLRYMAACGVIVLYALWSTAHLCGQETRWHKGVTADEMLKASRDKTPKCEPTTKTYDVGEDGSKTEAPASNDQREITDLLTLDYLFKPGRYILSFKENEGDEGRETIVIHFKPRPEKEQLDHPRGSGIKAQAATWAINLMSGDITLDRATGELMKIEGATPANLKGKKMFVTIGELHQLTFSHEQKLVNGTWVPKQTETELHYTALFHGTSHQSFSTSYCTDSKH